MKATIACFKQPTICCYAYANSKAYPLLPFLCQAFIVGYDPSPSLSTCQKLIYEALFTLLIKVCFCFDAIAYLVKTSIGFTIDLN